MLRTERLLLRQWRNDDAEPFARLNEDPEVMAHFPARLTHAQSMQYMHRYGDMINEIGYGFYAVERHDTGAFIGFVGVKPVSFEAAFTPAHEIGWRLHRAHWGQGLASEAARAVLADSFARLALPHVVAFTTPDNRRSRRVMERLGMTRDPADDFDHPALPVGHARAQHVLYRLSREEARP